MQSSEERAAQGWVLALTAAASFMVALDTLVVTTALGTISRDLGASVEALEWIVNAYNLSFAVLLLTGAALGDRFGRKRLFVGGIGLFVTSSAMCAAADDIGWLIAGRALQGAGAALVMPLAMALLSGAFPPDERGKALGIFSGLTGLAVLGGPVVGGAIADGIAWQWIFWLNLPVGLVVMPLASRRLRESFGPGMSLDFPGLALATGASFALVWGLVRGNEIGWAASETVATLLAGSVLALAFVAWERRSRAPMVPMRLFRLRAFAAGNGAGFLLSASLYGTLFFMAQFLQIAQGNSPLAAGLKLLPWTATLFLVAPIAGALVKRIGERSLIVIGLLLQAAGMAWIAAIASPSLPYIFLVAPLIVAGAGVSMAMPAAQNAVIGAVAPHEIGKASGVYNTLRFLGGAFGIAILVAIFTRNGGGGSPENFSAGFAPAIATAATFSLLGAVAGAMQPGRRVKLLAPAEA